MKYEEIQDIFSRYIETKEDKTCEDAPREKREGSSSLPRISEKTSPSSSLKREGQRANYYLSTLNLIFYLKTNQKSLLPFLFPLNCQVNVCKVLDIGEITLPEQTRLQGVVREAQRERPPALKISFQMLFSTKHKRNHVLHMYKNSASNNHSKTMGLIEEILQRITPYTSIL